MGHNGAGKTTLINILSGLDTEYDGEISFDLFDSNKTENISIGR